MCFDSQPLAVITKSKLGIILNFISSSVVTRALVLYALWQNAFLLNVIVNIAGYKRTKPAYMNIIQEYLLNVSEGRVIPMFNNDPYCYPMEEATDKDILFVKEDVLYELSEEELDKMFKGHARYTTQKEIDEAISQERSGTLVSLVVVAPEPAKGAYCYKMLISTDTYQLYFYRKHKISKRLKAGFMKEDIRRISTPYSFGTAKDE